MIEFFVNKESIKKKGIKVKDRDILEIDSKGMVRHHPYKLAATLYSLIDKMGGVLCLSMYWTVPSRRLGISLGVDLVLPKSCNMNCIFCECGATKKLTFEKGKV